LPASDDWHAINPATTGGHPVMMADVEEVEVVVAHSERATLRVGDVFLKIDADQKRTDVEVEAMRETGGSFRSQVRASGGVSGTGVIRIRRSVRVARV
jgi:hypothetical protein